MSSLETPMPSTPLSVKSVRLAAKFDVRFAKYRREPFAQSNDPFSPGAGPNATAGSPSETRPFS